MVFSDMDSSEPLEETENLDSLLGELNNELETILQEKREISNKIQQSQIEVNKLARRNASLNAQLQQNQLNDPASKELWGAYENALDTQQRLFVMRGQLEKLQGEEKNIERLMILLDRAIQVIQPYSGLQASGKSGSFATIEMMIQAQEDERQRLSQQMHDGPAQALSNFILQTEIATRLFDVDQERAREELSLLKGSATTTFQKVRDFIFELRPMMLDDLGLTPTLRRYADAIRDQAGIDIEVTTIGQERRTEAYLEVVTFRSFQELLRNATAHSLATEVKVQLDTTDYELRLILEDNGKGFESQEAAEAKNVGLRVVRERVEMLGGYFELDSTPGVGTRITFKLPIARSGLSG